MKHVLTLAFAFTILCSSCMKFLARVAGEYRNPRQETYAGLIKYAKSNGAVYDAMYVIKSEKAFFEVNKIMNNIPAVKIFNMEKKEIASLQGQHCAFAAAQTISVIDTMKQVLYIAGINYDSLFASLKIIDGTADMDHRQAYDNIIVFVWGKFVPKLSKKMFRSIKEATANTGKKYLVISINYDLQSGWYQKS